jgi:hypothetical protein
MSILRDPRFFNFVIIGLFLCSAIRWAFARDWPNAIYWAAGAVINCAVTWRA